MNENEKNKEISINACSVNVEPLGYIVVEEIKEDENKYFNIAVLKDGKKYYFPKEDQESYTEFAKKYNLSANDYCNTIEYLWKTNPNFVADVKGIFDLIDKYYSAKKKLELVEEEMNISIKEKINEVANKIYSTVNQLLNDDYMIKIYKLNNVPEEEIGEMNTSILKKIIFRHL